MTEEEAPRAAPKKKKKKRPKSATASLAPAEKKTEPQEIEDATDAPEEKVAALPGEGTADGELLREVSRAFDAGNYALVRKRAKALENAGDPDVRAAALEIASRTNVDPVQIVIVAACAVVLLAIVYTWVF